MNPTHIHLLLNHVSILGSLFSIVILFIGIYFKSEILKRTAYSGLVIAALVAIPVFLTGEDAEESVEHLSGVQKSTIHEHEEAAEFSIWMMELAGAISLLVLTLSIRSAKQNRILILLLILISVIAAASISYTGYLGGKIRHTELVTGNLGNQNNAQEEDDD